MAKKQEDTGRKSIARNKKAFHDYEVLESFEAGMELTGTEVRSLRENNCQLTDCFALIRGGECWLHGVHIAAYSHGTYNNVDPDRKRRLLLHKKEIRYLQEKVQQQGMALVPLNMYFNKEGRVKLELGLCRGRKTYDKRQMLAARDQKREMERAMKERYR